MFIYIIAYLGNLFSVGFNEVAERITFIESSCPFLFEKNDYVGSILILPFEYGF